MRIVSWQPVLTDHQSYTLAALAEAANADLTVYVRSAEHAGRAPHGWVARHASTLSPVVLPRRNSVRDSVRRLRESRDAVHIFGSPFEDARLIVALVIAVALGLRVFLVSEPYSPISASYLEHRSGPVLRLKTTLRPAAYRVFAALLRRGVAGVFAISPLAELQYKNNGFRPETVFPFGYFVPRAREEATGAVSVPPPRRPLKIIFVGALIPRKGLDVLIEAVGLACGSGTEATLDAFGGGDPANYAFDGRNVRYAGMIPFGDAQKVIAEYDLLVLPSRYDGWGVVVNEALLAGTPVICSSAVGAACVVRKFACGSVFESENSHELASQISGFAANPSALQQATSRTTAAAASLDPKQAGLYMAKVIRGAKREEVMRELALGCA